MTKWFGSDHGVGEDKERKSESNEILESEHLEVVMSKLAEADERGY